MRLLFFFLCKGELYYLTNIYIIIKHETELDISQFSYSKVNTDSHTELRNTSKQKRNRALQTMLLHHHLFILNSPFHSTSHLVTFPPIYPTVSTQPATTVDKVVIDGGFTRDPFTHPVKGFSRFPTFPSLQKASQL